MDSVLECLVGLVALLGSMLVYSQRRNAKLADRLVGVVEESSRERLRLQSEHAAEMDRVREHALLSQQSLLASTLLSVEQGLTARLRSLASSSQNASGQSTERE